MKTFNCLSVNQEMITLNSSSQVGELYNHIMKGTEDFILSWEEKKGFKGTMTKKTKIIVLSKIKDKVKNGEIRIGSEE